MPSFETDHFGPIEYGEDAVFEFPEGLPGFEAEKRFLFMEQAEARPLVFVQSLSTPGLCFIAAPVQAVKPDYRLCLSPDDIFRLGLPSYRQPEMGLDVLCLAIISIEEHQPPTANLLAPVIVNLQTRCGFQTIQQNSGYSHRDPFPSQKGETPCS